MPTYLTAAQFAEALGISPEMARKALRRAGQHGKPYKGVHLDVAQEKTRSAKGGVSWVVNAASVERVQAGSRNHDIADPTETEGESGKGSDFAADVIALPVSHSASSKSEPTQKVPTSGPQGFRHDEKQVPTNAAECGPSPDKVGTIETTAEVIKLPTPKKVPTSDQDCGPLGTWLTAKQFAGLAGVVERVSRRILKKGVYKGHPLTVETVEGAGGKDGNSYRVDASSLPQPLYDLWKATQTPVITPMGEEIGGDPALFGGSDIARWRFGLIRNALFYPEGSPERGRAVAAVIGPHVAPDGRTKRVGRRTLYDWIARYNADGLAGLANKPKGTAGKRRVIVSRTFDTAAREAGLAPADLEKIDEALVLYIRSLWSNGMPGWRNILLMSKTRLQDFAREAGWQADLALCDISRRKVEAWRGYEIIAEKDRDAKSFFDGKLPRITRTRDGYLPMHLVIGDVHHLDIVIKRPDGRDAYPKIIAWHDIATNRLYATLIILEEGEGVRQKHIGLSFAAMCEAWGLPRTLYLDNGSEYKWDEMMAAFAELATACHGRIDVKLQETARDVADVRAAAVRNIVRARAYNAPAKAIEAIFGILEGSVFKALPGYIGGDRTNAKKEHVGRPPKAYDKGYEAFHETLDNALEFYHNKPQGGFLDGKSPYDALRAAIDDGWQAVKIDADTLLMAFAKEKRKTARKGRVSWNGVTFYHDDLLEFTGKTLRVRVAPHKPDIAYVFGPDGLICVCAPERKFDHLDGEGAREQARRAKALNRTITAKRRNTSRLDLEDEMRRHVKRLEAVNGGAPEIPGDISVTASPEAERMKAAAVKAETDRINSMEEPAPADEKLSPYRDIEDEDAQGLGW